VGRTVRGGQGPKDANDAMKTLQEELADLPKELQAVLMAVAVAGKEVAEALRTASVQAAGNTNAYVVVVEARRSVRRVPRCRSDRG